MMLKLGPVLIIHKYSVSELLSSEDVMQYSEFFFGGGGNFTCFIFRGSSHFIFENSVVVVAVASFIMEGLNLGKYNGYFVFLKFTRTSVVNR